MLAYPDLYNPARNQRVSHNSRYHGKEEEKHPDPVCAGSGERLRLDKDRKDLDFGEFEEFETREYG